MFTVESVTDEIEALRAEVRNARRGSFGELIRSNCSSIAAFRSTVRPIRAATRKPLPVQNAAGGAVKTRVIDKRSKKFSKWVPVESMQLDIIPRLPPHTTWIALKTNFRVDDCERLTHIPYFGENDTEDVVGRVYEEHQLHTKGHKLAFERCNRILDEDDFVLEWWLNVRFPKALRPGEIPDDVKGVLADAFSAPINQAAADKGFADATIGERLRRVLAGRSTPRDAADTFIKRLRRGTARFSAPVSPPANETELMDSCRSLLCLRCFVYDCAAHGHFTNPQIERNEKKWQKTSSAMKQLRFCADGDACGGRCFKKVHSSGGVSFQLPALSGDKKLLWKKALVECRGDACSAASIVGAECRQMVEMAHAESWVSSDANAPTIEDYYASRGTILEKTPEHVKCPRCPMWILKRKMHLHKKRCKSKLCARASSASNDIVPKYAYREVDTSAYARTSVARTLLKRQQSGNTVAPFQTPCQHEGPCSAATNCPCFLKEVFCTKYCSCYCNDKKPCKLFFPGCSCTKQCRTKACPCFCAGRECDPDLCTKCGADTHPDDLEGARNCCNVSITYGKRKHIVMAPSDIPHAGWGAFICEAARKDEFIHEYVGELISQDEAERRGMIQDKINRSYVFNLNEDFCVDAFHKGNKTKFANHSSTPNCYPKIITVLGCEHRIGLFAKKDLAPGTELLFDYNYNKKMHGSEGLEKSSMVVDWMLDPSKANTIRKRKAIDQIVPSPTRRLVVPCVVCAKDTSLGDASCVLMCDSCNGEVHMQCCDPPISSVPEGDFFCPRCKQGGSRASKKKRKLNAGAVDAAILIDQTNNNEIQE